jgi:hypothetical protein
LAVFADLLNALAVGAPLLPGFRIFSPEPALMRLRLAWMLAYKPFFLAIFIYLSRQTCRKKNQPHFFFFIIFFLATFFIGFFFAAFFIILLFMFMLLPYISSSFLVRIFLISCLRTSSVCEISLTDCWDWPQPFYASFSGRDCVRNKHRPSQFRGELSARRPQPSPPDRSEQFFCVPSLDSQQFCFWLSLPLEPMPPILPCLRKRK